MEINLETFEQLDKPYYILEEKKLRRNLNLIKHVADTSGAEIILAFKAYALWKTFPIFREYINSTTASSLYEARMALEKFGSKAHTYSPAYCEREIKTISECSSHITFNSMSQYERFHETVKKYNPEISIGLRINPEYSEVGTDIYNPCAPGTRFGISAGKLPEVLPADIDGFHCHCHCENGSDVFQRTLKHIEEKFDPWFDSLKWVNFGGGHLMTRKGYDTGLLVNLIETFREKHPNLKVILEPGSAFAWQTGELVAQVVDIVEDKGIKTAILNVSFTCHMPDCLEMPYKPEVRHAVVMDDTTTQSEFQYRLGGNSCLSGDYIGSWKFDHKLEIGENIIFEDMIHYTTVKTCMFNGVPHPAIAIVKERSNKLEILREYAYEDYLERMD